MKSIYKQVWDLTIDDLIKYPYWEYISEDDENAEDECTVKGYNSDFDNIEGYGRVFTEFIFNDKTIHYGSISPDEDLCHSQPLIYIGNEKISFWNGIRKYEKNEIEDIYKSIQKTKYEIFPITWNTKIKLIGLPETGLIKGFGYIEGDEEIFLL